MNSMQSFSNPEFGEIRTITKDGEVWFVGSDVAKALGYKKPTNAVMNLVDEGDTLHRGIIDHLGRKQVTIVINEIGLYSLIFSSTLQNAKKFKKWVTSEVLPSINKTGSYGVPTTTQDQIKLLAQGYGEIQERIDTVSESVQAVKSDFDAFKEDCPLFPADADRISQATRHKGVEVMGGKHSPAYHDRSIVQLVYRDIYGEIHRNFACRSYKEIPRKHIGKVLEVVSRYSLPLSLKEKIDTANTQ